MWNRLTGGGGAPSGLALNGTTSKGTPPVEHDVGQRRVLTDENENRRTRLVVLLPGRAFRFPKPGQHSNRRVRPFQDRLRLRAGVFATALGGRQPARLENPAPDIEVTWNLRARRVADGKLRNLHQTGLDGVHQAEVAHHPREWPVGFLAHAAEEVRRG